MQPSDKGRKNLVSNNHETGGSRNRWARSRGSDCRNTNCISIVYRMMPLDNKYMTHLINECSDVNLKSYFCFAFLFYEIALRTE